MTLASAISVVLVDDDDDLRTATGQLLSIAGFTVQPFADGVEALAAIGADFAGIVITDVRMPRMSGVELLDALRERDAELPVILITGHGDVAMAVDALRRGAWDFLTKPFDPDVLLAAASRAATARALQLENRQLRRDAGEAAAGALIGEAPAIVRLRNLVPMLADADIDLVIEGETGTGKELLARLIHRAGRRGRHRFTVVDCATIPDAVIEKELFARHGIIARSDRGTLFLDNLDQAHDDLQHRLRRFMEARAVAIDARDPDPVDIRIVAALPDGGRDRISSALYHRIAGVPLRMPPLAERLEDLPILFAHLVSRAADTLKRPPPPLGELPFRLASREWPGNVRELEKLAERFCLGLEIEDGAPLDTGASLPARMDAFECAQIEEAVTMAKGDVSLAIKALKIPRKTFYYRVKRLGIDLGDIRGRARGRP